MSIRIPDSLHNAIKELATEDGYSMNQFLITAAAEKISALKTIDYLQERAARGSFKDFDRAMAKVPRVDPEPGDELPKNYKRRTRRRS